MTSLMVESVKSMIKSWETIVENDGGQSELNVDIYFRSLSADIISKACFGSNYYEGKEIFRKIRGLQVVMSKENIGIPGFRYIYINGRFDPFDLEKKSYAMHTLTMKPFTFLSV